MVGRSRYWFLSAAKAVGWMVVALPLTWLAPGPALAQTSRQAELAKRKAEKARHLRPNLPGRGERLIERVEGVFMAPPPGWSVAFGGFRSGAGLAPGIAYRVALGERGMWTTGAGYSLKSFKRLESRADFDRLADGRVRLGAGVAWEDAPQLSYYGLGSGSARGDQTSYGLQEKKVGVNAEIRPVRVVRIGGGVDWLAIETGGGAGPKPSIEERFDERTAPGLSADPTWIRSSAYAGIDWREGEGYTRSGGLYRITLSDYADRDDDRYDFRHVALDLQQFVPLLRENWVIAARLHAQVTDRAEHQVIPHFMLPYVGGGSSLRGFGQYRFVDRHAILLSTELRWTPSRFLDMALFYDQGKAVAERRDLDFRGLKSAWGVGARFHGPQFTALRLDVGRSREGTRLHIGASAAF